MLGSRASFFYFVNLRPRCRSGATFPRANRGSEGHLVEPTPQDRAIVDSAGLARQRKESCLKGVFGVLVATEDVPADPSTIGPCRLTKVSKAVSESSFSPVRNESISCSSDRIGFIRLISSLLKLGATRRYRKNSPRPGRRFESVQRARLFPRRPRRSIRKGPG